MEWLEDLWNDIVSFFTSLWAKIVDFFTGWLD